MWSSRIARNRIFDPGTCESSSGMELVTSNVLANDQELTTSDWGLPRRLTPNDCPIPHHLGNRCELVAPRSPSLNQQMRRHHRLPAIGSESKMAAIMHENNSPIADMPIAGLHNLRCRRHLPVPTRHAPHDGLKF